MGRRDPGPIYTEVQIQGSVACSLHSVVETHAGPCQIDLHTEFATLPSVSLTAISGTNRSAVWQCTSLLPPQTQTSLHMVAGSLLYTSH